MLLHMSGKRFVGLLLLQGLALAPIACERRPALDVEILGRWAWIELDGRAVPPEYALYFEFFKDATMIFEYRKGDKKPLVGIGTYSVLDSTRIKYQLTSVPSVDPFLWKPSAPVTISSISISGNHATLVELDGRTIKLKRVNSKG